jgi:hypothetical protein
MAINSVPVGVRLDNATFAANQRQSKLATLKNRLADSLADPELIASVISPSF